MTSVEGRFAQGADQQTGHETGHAAAQVPPLHPPLWMMRFVGLGDVADTDRAEQAWTSACREAEQRFWAQVADLGLPAADLDVFEFGCGCGRLATGLAGHVRRYKGVDVNADQINYNKLSYPQGEFEHLNFYNEMYNPGGKLVRIAIDEPALSFDVVYGASVLTHLRSRHVADVIMESARLLRPGGLLIQSIYLQRSALQGRNTIPRGTKNPVSIQLDAVSWSVSAHSNEFIVYDEGYLFDVAARHGLECHRIERGPWGGLQNPCSDWQDWIILKKMPTMTGKRAIGAVSQPLA